MNPMHRIPTKDEEEGVHRKVTLVLSMLGHNTDLAMTVLLYSLSMRTLADGVVLENVINNLRMVHAQIERSKNASR